MSDYPEEVIEAAKARDNRFRVVEMAIALETELRDSRAVNVWLDALKADALVAMEEFADANPADLPAVIMLQLRMKLWTETNRAIERGLAAGRKAEAELRNEDFMEDN